MIVLESKHPDSYSVCEMLPYAFQIDDGIVLCKDGGILTGWQVSCEDFTSLTPAHRDYLIAQLVSSMGNLGDGWSFHFDYLHKSANPTESSVFPDPVSQGIDDERVSRFNEKGGSFESETYLTLKWTPSKNVESRLVSLFLRRIEKDHEVGQHLDNFRRQVDEFEDSASTTLTMRRLRKVSSDDLGLPGNNERSFILSHINHCLWDEWIWLAHWPGGMYADMMIAAHPIWFGTRPLLNGKHAGLLCIDGFPSATSPGMLNSLSHLPFPFRWNTRFTMLSEAQATRVIKRMRDKWEQAGRSLLDQFMNQTPKLDARQKRSMAMVEDVDDALAEQMMSDVRYGHYTSTFIVRSKNVEDVNEMLRQLRKQLTSLNFQGRIEHENAPAALMGSLPGEVSHNVRRPLLHSMHFANLIPLSSAWTGNQKNPSPLIEGGSAPALARVAAAGRDVFDLNVHVGDVGHALVFGATGSGKSVFLAFLAAQFRRYKNSRVVIFDKGMSMRVLTNGVNGNWRELGFSSGHGFAPIASLANSDQPIEEQDQIWVMDWIDRIFALNREGKSLSPIQKRLVREGVRMLSEPNQSRSLLDLKIAIQDEEVQAVLEKYCGSGEYSLLFDDQEDRAAEIDNPFCCYEVDELLSLPKRASLPLLLYLFYMVEKRATGNPSMIILDEAWALLADPAFAAQITEWLKTMRKKNVAVVMATQSLSDLLDSKMVQIITESCPTRIFGANPEATSTAKEGYLQLGMGERDVEVIASLTMKREYYITVETQRKVISLDLTPAQLRWLAVSDPKSIREILELQEKHPETWREVYSGG